MTRDDLDGRYAEETLQILTEARAILDNDHFVYISGDHGSGWIDKDAIFPHTDRLEQLCRDLANGLKDWGIEVVCGPATGGMIVAQWAAHELGALAVFTEHDPAPEAGALRGRFGLHRGFDQLVIGKRVLVVDDIVNTGLSLRQTAEAVSAAGGTVIGSACLVSRGNVTADEFGGGRFACLLEYKIPAWPASQCKLCRDGVPINVRHAHGADYVALKRTGH